MTRCGDLNTKPLHVGLIPDGNRRWAKREGVNYITAYNRGYEVLKEILELLLETGVKYVSVYVMSRDNCLKRSRLELSILEALAIRGFRELRADSKIRSKNIGVSVLGDLGLLSRSVREEAERTISELNPEGSTAVLYLAICYGGRWEVEYYSKRGLVPPSLRMPPIDLVIRTGGRRRLSDFFPLASSYAELYFTDTLWPDLSPSELCKALEWYSKQERLFGK